MTRPTYRLTLTPADDGFPPPELRLRKLLKLALRVCGLRCLEHVEVKQIEDRATMVDVEDQQ